MNRDGLGSTTAGTASTPTPNMLTDTYITCVLTIALSIWLTFVDIDLSKFECPGYVFAMIPSGVGAFAPRLLAILMLSLFITSVALFFLWKFRHPGVPSYRTAVVKFSGLTLPISALILVNTIAVGNTCVSSKGVFIRAHPWNVAVRSGWRDVRSIKIACQSSRLAGTTYMYSLNMISGRQVAVGYSGVYRKYSTFNVPEFTKVAQMNGLSMPALPALTECT